MKPQDYSRRTRYRPPAAWYRAISNRLGVLLTSLGLAPKDAVTLEVRSRRTGQVRRTPVLLTPFRAMTTWWRWPESPSGTATSGSPGVGP